MVPAEAPLHLRTLVGNSSPTTLQTLIDLLKLYDSGDTDVAKWVQLIESDSLLLYHFASTSTAPALSDWATNFSIAHMQGQLLAIANGVHSLGDDQVVATRDNRLVALLCTALSGYLQLPHGRKAGLTGQLAGTGFQSHEPDVAEALKYHNRELAHLEDTDLFVRLIAVAYQLVNSDESETATEGARLLGVDEASLNGILEGVREEAAFDIDEKALSTDFEHHLASLNLKNTFRILLQSLGAPSAFKQLAMALFGISSLRLFMLKDAQWTDGEFVLTGRNSIIVAASRHAETVSSLAHSMTVVDEKLLAGMNVDEALAVPIVADPVAVVLLGMHKNKLVELANNQEAIERFIEIGTFGLNEYHGQERVSRSTLDAAAREIIHEANNPLSTVQNYLKVLSLKLEPEHDAQETLQTISEELFRASDIIDRFRSLGESTTASSEQHCVVNEVLKRQSDLFSKAHDGIAFTLSLDKQNPEISMGSDSLTQIIANLIKNAAEACNSGDEISITSLANIRQGNSTFVEIIVRDTGPGISDSMHNIFERGESTKTGDQRGQGLAVVKELMDKADAIISYRTSPAGTEFRLNIPQYNNTR